MLLTRRFLVVSLVGSLALGEAFEPANFSAAQELNHYDIDVSSSPDLADLAYHSATNACERACRTLKKRYGSDQVIVQGTAGYDNFTAGYWSLNQVDVDPRCIFKPTKPADVSALVLLSRYTQCPFAAKSGGHAAFAGGSSIQGGITMSFEKMNSVKLSSDKKIASVQPGNRWGTVYTELAKSELTVLGGRVYDIGVGGLTLGGGISFFSSIYGWACDNVQSFEVVTANGKLVTASPTSSPDLYWALRGGGNNFGLVVKFNLNTIPLPKNTMWGGSRVYTENNFPALSDAFADVVADSPKDKNAGIWVAFIHFNGSNLASTELWYAKPDGDKAQIFSGLKAITPVVDMAKNRQLTEYTSHIQESNPYGLRELYYCLTTKANRQLITEAKDIFYQEIAALANVTNVNPVLLFQGITVPEIQQMSKNGGNPLGLNEKDGPLYLVALPFWWQNESDDKLVYRVASRIMERIKQKAKARGVQNDYLYMNYASQYENVIKSYGTKNQAKLQQIAKRYDPQQVFQKLQPGYFKLDRAPIPNSGYFSG